MGTYNFICIVSCWLLTYGHNSVAGNDSPLINELLRSIHGDLKTFVKQDNPTYRQVQFYVQNCFGPVEAEKYSYQRDKPFRMKVFHTERSILKNGTYAWSLHKSGVADAFMISYGNTFLLKPCLLTEGLYQITLHVTMLTNMMPEEYELRDKCYLQVKNEKQLASIKGGSEIIVSNKDNALVLPNLVNLGVPNIDAKPRFIWSLFDQNGLLLNSTGTFLNISRNYLAPEEKYVVQLTVKSENYYSNYRQIIKVNNRTDNLRISNPLTFARIAFLENYANVKFANAESIFMCNKGGYVP